MDVIDHGADRNGLRHSVQEMIASAVFSDSVGKWMIHVDLQERSVHVSVIEHDTLFTMSFHFMKPTFRELTVSTLEVWRYPRGACQSHP